MLVRIYLTKFKEAFQRAIRGFSDIDAMNLSFWFREIMDKMIRWRLKNNEWYPCDMTSESWEDTLIDMLEHLRMMDDDAVYKEMFGDKDTCLLSIDDWMRVEKTIDFHKDEFMKLFNKHFWSL